MYNINKISPDDHEFLQIITNIDNSVKSLWYIGKLPQQGTTAVAIVGTRKPTAYGKEITYKFSYELAKKGIVVISGLAIGTDGIAHQAALDAGGITIAVLPTGLDAIAPYSHRKLAADIVKSGGALVSEYKPGAAVFKSNFIARNRLVSGLSGGVLVTEATRRSGTLSTINFALQQGKSVMAVPGNITSPMSAGCNNFIKHGATPITELKDILEELGVGEPGKAALPLVYTDAESKLVKLLAAGVRDGEELQQQSGLDANEFNQTLTMLEIDGKIRALGANNWTLR